MNTLPVGKIATAFTSAFFRAGSARQPFSSIGTFHHLRLQNGESPWVGAPSTHKCPTAAITKAITLARSHIFRCKLATPNTRNVPAKKRMNGVSTRSETTVADRPGLGSVEPALCVAAPTLMNYSETKPYCPGDDGTREGL